MRGGGFSMQCAKPCRTGKRRWAAMGEKGLFASARDGYRFASRLLSFRGAITIVSSRDYYLIAKPSAREPQAPVRRVHKELITNALSPPYAFLARFPATIGDMAAGDMPGHAPAHARHATTTAANRDTTQGCPPAICPNKCRIWTTRKIFLKKTEKNIWLFTFFVLPLLHY